MKNLNLPLNSIFNTIFWGWNLIFLTVVYLGILPIIGFPLVIATLDGDIPWDFGLTFFTLIAVPAICTFNGIKYYNQQPKKLMRLFYGVEAPLVTWCLVRLFIVRELSLASGLVLGTLLICILAFAWELLEGDRFSDPKLFWLRAIAHTLLLFMGVYLGTVLLFYAIPVALTIVKWLGYFIVGFFSFGWVEAFWRILTHGGYLIGFFILGCLFFILFAFSATLFVGMPLAVTTLYVSSGQKILRAFARQHGVERAIALGVAIIALWTSLLFSFNQQPQVRAFNLLEKVPHRQELLASSNIIRQGLVNANLYPYRYLSTKEDNNHIYALYNRLGLPKSAALFVQHQYNQLLSPFLYDGSRQDVQKAAKLYAEFFDTPLQKAERSSVRHAIQSTAIVDRAQAGLLNIDQKKVWLETQEVNLTPYGDWADVEIHEVYQNQTNDVEEILYYFSLPESAAVTGLWLGDEREVKRFQFQIAPRGAAQEVYNSQVQRTRPIDPALLEQVGHRQYRLRAFPIPPRLSSSERARGETQPKMHLWLTYKVMKERGWALPKLIEQRNIFWTRSTKRIRNGKVQRGFADAWLEDWWSDMRDTDKKSYRINLQDGYTVAIQPIGDRPLPKNQRYALILDTSYSMGSHVKAIEATLNWYRDNLIGNDVDLYITDAKANQAKRLNAIDSWNIREQTFFGSLQIEDMLQQFQLLSSNNDYNAILLVTDEGSYELSEDEREVAQMQAPLWMIHLGGLPRAYNDGVLQAIQNSNGGVATNIESVMQRLATEAEGLTVVDGYSWKVEKSNNTTRTNSNSIEPLAARQLVSSLSQSSNKLSLPELDAIHRVAKNYEIVTPYSSMIVLVNDRQQQMLREAESRSDRFEREVETGIEQLNVPFNPFEVSGVPEPDTWILLAIVVLALVLILRRQQANIID